MAHPTGRRLGDGGRGESEVSPALVGPGGHEGPSAGYHRAEPLDRGDCKRGVV